MPRELLSYRDIPKETSRDRHGAWPLVIPILVTVFEIVLAIVMDSRGVRRMELAFVNFSGLLMLFAWPLGIVACLLGICYAIEDIRRRINPPLAQLAMMLNALVIAGIVLRIIIAS
jgi:hypothetical protein